MLLYVLADEIIDKTEVKYMQEAITIQVSDRAVRRATQAAAQTQKRIEEILADWLEWVITEMPVDSLPDDEVIALTQLQPTPNLETRLSHLLERNRENALDVDGKRELDELMRQYERGLLRKAQALRVAVQRGIREPHQS